MLIYTEEISVRLIYTLDFVFKDHQLDYQLTNDWNDFSSSRSDKMIYSRKQVSDFPHLFASTLLFEEYYRSSVLVETSEWCGVSCLKLEHVVDPLAAIFYVLARYEEYGMKFPDKHGRFTSKESVLSKNNWLSIQIVERWVEAFLLEYSPKSYKKWKDIRTSVCIPSFDIDNTFAHQWKEGWRSWLSITKDLITGNKNRREERYLVQSGKLKDPFDSFDKIKKVASDFPQTRVFWHVGDYAKYDTNIFWNDPRHAALIEEMSNHAFIGLHPSYASNLKDSALQNEAFRIRKLTGEEVVESRQHFLKLQLPQTYLRLTQQGFRKDFSMGYADNVGFRAGTAYEHTFFNVLTNTIHPNYRIVPFCYMDGTLHEYLKLTPEKSILLVRELCNEVKKYGGVFCFIWHNETLAEAGKWKGWGKVFDKTIAEWNASN